LPALARPYLDDGIKGMRVSWDPTSLRPDAAGEADLDVDKRDTTGAFKLIYGAEMY
jgi:hypothetical protein